MLFAAAVASASGWRSIAVRRVGYCLLAVGVLVLVARRVLAPALANALVSVSTYRQAAHAAWTISTIETLTLGVQGKMSLWIALNEVADQYPSLASVDLDDLIERARSQHSRLERERIAASKLALRNDVAT